MSAVPHDLEQIVREVLRRLRELENTNETPAKAAPKQEPSTLEISDRLVTLATLHGKLVGIERVIITTKSIITPAAKDELAGRKIKLELAAGTSKSQPTGRLLLAATDYNAGPLLGKLSAVAQIKQIIEADWKEAVRKMTNELKQTLGGGVILTNRPAAAACLANRDAAIRAAVASDARSLQDAKSLDANLLVVDPAAHSLYALQNLLKEYAKYGQRQLPL